MSITGAQRAWMVDRLRVKVYPDRAAMGRAAAQAVARHMRDRLAHQAGVRMVFASAPSQVEFLAALSREPDLDWARVTAFHMDEYIGVASDAPQSFARFICDHLLDRVGVGRRHLLDGLASITRECVRYAALLRDAPIDIVCMGIGENGHIAFNDPPVADFSDPVLVKIVELDRPCREQQVHDGCFPTFDAVPRFALTMTVPALVGASFLSVVVPASSKAEAVRATLEGPIAPSCPASVVRLHANATLFLDPDSARLLTIPPAE